MGREIRVCGVADVGSGSARRFDVEDHRIALVHVGADWYAIGDRCSHQDYSLADGEVWADERELECPKHGSSFSLVTGEPRSLPATRPVPVYEVRVIGDDVRVVLP